MPSAPVVLAILQGFEREAQDLAEAAEIVLLEVCCLLGGAVGLAVG